MRVRAFHSLFRWGDRDMDRRRASFFPLCTYQIKAFLPRTSHVAHTFRTKCLQVKLVVHDNSAHTLT